MVKKLDISNSNISYDGVAAISDCLKENDSLQELNISARNVGDTGTLIVSDHKLFGNALIVIMDCLKNCSGLQQLYLSQNEIGVEEANKCAEVIQINTTLQIFDISHCGIPYDGIVIIIDSLKNNRSLKFFDISHSKINVAGAKMLSEMIQVNATLQELDISHCDILNDGILTICA